MKHVLAGVTVSFVVGASSFGGQPSLAERFRASGAIQLVDEFVARQMRQDRTPGVALGLTSRDATLMLSTYGFADIRARVPLTPEHLLEIGGISKAFTAVALMQQRDAGRFDPGAPISRYLPWLQESPGGHTVTGHQLLTHTAGLPRDRDEVPSSPFQAAAARGWLSRADPGSRFWYSNVGYQILGQALAAIAGRPYPDVIRDSVFRPLGMDASDAQITHETRLRLAVGYESLYDDRPPHASHPLVPAAWLEYASGDGSIASTPGDMIAFTRMLLSSGRTANGPLVSGESFGLLQVKAAQVNDSQWYGYGFKLFDVGGRMLLGHDGAIVGYRSSLVADPTDALGVIVMTNGPATPRTMADFALTVARAVMNGSELPPPPPANDPLRVPDAADYAGTYESESDGSLLVVAEGDRLWLSHGPERVFLERRGQGRFYANHRDFSRFLLQFSRDAERQVIDVAYGGAWYVSERYAGPRRPSYPERWGAFTGHYRAPHPWFNNFRVVLRAGQLRLVEPDGSERLLVPVSEEEFALDTTSSPERVSFDTIVDGRALRVHFSGTSYYRTFTP